VISPAVSLLPPCGGSVRQRGVATDWPPGLTGEGMPAAQINRNIATAMAKEIGEGGSRSSFRRGARGILTNP
jgi:hypothetical protein